MLRGFMLCSEAENHPVLISPAAMLDLLWAILAEARETRADPRLSELRRRRAG